MFGSPSLEITRSPVVVFQGSNVTLTCTGTLKLQSAGLCNHTNCASFIPWTHGLVKLDGFTSEMFRDGLLVVSSELHLNSVTLSNAGYYTCQINYGNEGFPQSILLSVTS